MASIKKTILFFLVSTASLSGNAQPASNPTTTMPPTVKLNAQNSPVQQDPNSFNLAVQDAAGEQLPSITNEQMQYLFKNLSNIDYTFLGAEFSMSADGDNAKTNLQHISTRAAKKLTGDKPKALIFYSAGGNIALQAELYFGDDQLHQYLVFIKEGKVVGANYLSPGGVAFFKQVVGAKVQQAPAAKQETH